MIETFGIQNSYGYSPTLAKACIDPFFYVARLKSGLVLTFEIAEPICDKFVILKNMEDERGLEVKVAEIELIADGGIKYQSVWRPGAQ